MSDRWEKIKSDYYGVYWVIVSLRHPAYLSASITAPMRSQYHAITYAFGMYTGRDSMFTTLTQAKQWIEVQLRNSGELE